MTGERKHRSIDLSKIEFASPISTEDATRDITPIWWADDIIQGKRKAVISKGGVPLCQMSEI